MDIAIPADYASQPTQTKLDHLPGNYSWPVVGDFYSVLNDFYGLVDRHYRRYGPVSRIGMTGMKGALVIGPDMMQQIFLNSDRSFAVEPAYKPSLGRFYEDCLLVQDFEVHRYNRRLMQSAFKTSTMETYINPIHDISKDVITEWGNKPQMLFYPQIKTLLIHVAWRIFVGMDNLGGEEAQKLHDTFIDVNEGTLKVVKVDLPGFPFHRSMNAKRYMQKYFLQLVNERRQHGSQSGTDMLSHMCFETDDDGNTYTDVAIARHLAFLLFAAHDTTTSALCHVLYHVGKNPQWQERIRDEIMALGKEDNLTAEDMNALPSIDLVFQEALRLHPSVPMLTRRTTKDCQLGGYDLPANTVLFIPTSYNHMLEDYWTKPKIFDPERFNDERAEQKRHSFSYFPFGGGAHKCLGMHYAGLQAKCFLYAFLRHYRFKTPDDYNPKLLSVPLPRPGDDLPLMLEPIS